MQLLFVLALFVYCVTLGYAMAAVLDDASHNLLGRSFLPKTVATGCLLGVKGFSSR